MTFSSRRPPALELHEVICRPGDTGSFVLSIDTFEVDRGEAIALFGPSGAGKSTLMNVLALALCPARIGRFAIRTHDGRTLDIGALWAAGDDDRLTRIRSLHHGYVLQQGGLLPYLSVRDNIGLGLDLLGRSDRARVEMISERLDIAPMLDRPPATLSVGQRQRVAIARALAHRPEFLLADEPTASVHPSLADAILQLLMEQALTNDCTLLLTTHDPERAARHGFAMVALAADTSRRGERSNLSRRRPVGSTAA